MADQTKIEWADATWNPITGCSVVSPGCTNCYAMKLAGTRMKHHPSQAGLTKPSKAGPVWTGEVRFNEQWLDQPLRWRKPRMIFVCAHGDLFAEGVPDEWIDRVFAVMALAPQHTFQVLTKRPERIRTYLASGWRSSCERIEAVAYAMSARFQVAGMSPAWPLPNVWLGTSVEDQRRADERIPILLDTPAAVHWISAEPLLAPIDLTSLSIGPEQMYGFRHLDALDGGYYSEIPRPAKPPHPVPGVARLDWVVAGGESGPNARPMHPDWARSLRDQCVAAGVPFHFKQWGEWLPWQQKLADGCENYLSFGKRPEKFRILDAPAPDDVEITSRVGKARAGRTLDGKIWDQFPEAFRLAAANTRARHPKGEE